MPTRLMTGAPSRGRLAHQPLGGGEVVVGQAFEREAAFGMKCLQLFRRDPWEDVQRRLGEPGVEKARTWHSGWRHFLEAAAACVFVDGREAIK